MISRKKIDLRNSEIKKNFHLNCDFQKKFVGFRNSFGLFGYFHKSFVRYHKKLICLKQINITISSPVLISSKDN
jgi:hypothetical protein